MRRERPAYLPAPDGLPARVGGPYVEDKLGWLGDYLTSALSATTRKLDREYLDLFAGPGLTIDPDTANLYPSGALRAVVARAPGTGGVAFTRARLVNVNPDHTSALQHRISAAPLALPVERIECITADSNASVAQLLQGIHPQAYVFAFADPENPAQLPFDTLRQLRAHGHQSIDLYLLFPWGMGIRRMIPWGRTIGPTEERILNDFYGTEEWHAIVSSHATAGRRRERSLALRRLYMRQIESLGWPRVSEAAQVNQVGDRNLYWMLFATGHEAGDRIARGVSAARLRSRTAGQADLFG